MNNPSLKDIKEGVSAVTTGREFHNSTVPGKKLILKQSVEGENCLNFLVCDDLVLAFGEVKYADVGMSTRSGTTSYKRVSWILLLVTPIVDG